MRFDIARQPLVPAFLTLLLIAVVAMRGADPHALPDRIIPPTTDCAAASGTETPPAALRERNDAPGTEPAETENVRPGLAVRMPAVWSSQFQHNHPGWARWIGGLLLIFGGMCTGRLTVRNNLYSVGTCLAIPLYAIAACAPGFGGDFLTALAGAALLAFATKNYCRSFRNGYAFDAVFRASLYLGTLPLLLPATLPLAAALPLAVLIFRRTLREAAVACAGLLLPAAALCYINWGAGGEFSAPLSYLGTAFLAGRPLALFSALPLPNLLPTAAIGALGLLAALFVLSDLYAVGTKPRFILIYNIVLLALTAAVLCGPGAVRTDTTLIAVPAAILLPFLFVRIHRAIVWPLYLILLAFTLISSILQ